MPQSYLTRLLDQSEAQESDMSAEVQKREEELDSISTDWAQLSGLAERETATWTVTQVRDADGKITAGPFKSYGRHPKRTIENTPARQREWWIGPSLRTEHVHITAKSFPEDVNGACFDKVLGGDHADDCVILGNPVVEPDGTKTIACLHFISTPNEATGHASPPEIIEVACVLVNRNNLRIVDEFHSFVRPGSDIHNFSRLFYAVTLAQTEKIETENGFAAVWRKLEDWLMLRNVLDKHKRCWDGNPTVFVVEGHAQLGALLPLQLQLNRISMPAYLEDWLDLSLLFKRHFRCGKCSGCTTRSTGSCRARFSIPQMMRNLPIFWISRMAL